MFLTNKPFTNVPFFFLRFLYADSFARLAMLDMMTNAFERVRL